MDKWRTFIDRSGEDIWSIIEQSIILAHTEHYDELRLRRDGFAELMFGPRLHKGSESVRNAGSSDKTNASSGVYKAKQEDNEDVEKEPPHVKYEDEYDDESEEEQLEDDREEEGKEIVQIDSDYEDDEPAGHDLVPHDSFDDDLEALTDDKERAKLLMNEIYSIKNAIDRLPAGSFLPEDEAMDILYRVQELNISVTALKDTKIGQSISKYRKHPVKSVKAKAKEIVSDWKLLVDEYMATVNEGMPIVSATANDEAGEAEVGLATPPLDDGFVNAMNDVREFFNISESDLSAASGPSPASDGPSIVYQSGRKSSSSPDQDLVARDSKGEARVLKVERHRPVHMERKPDQNQGNAANSSGNIRRESNARRGIRSSSGINSTTVPRAPASGSAPARLQSAGAVRKSSARPTPNVGGIRPRVETTKPGLATKPEPLSNDLNVSKLEASKKRLNAHYHEIENAKKQRTVRPLELTELPKGGPKAQRPGQQRGWSKPVK